MYPKRTTAQSQHQTAYTHTTATTQANHTGQDTLVKGGLYDFSDPRKIGNGSWFMMHSASVDAETRDEKLFVCKMIRGFCDRFKCGDCKGHCKEYVDKNPPEDSINSTDGLFFWTVEFRNAVQRRLGAPLYSPNIMYDIFHDVDFMVCREDCNKNTSVQHIQADENGYNIYVNQSRVQEMKKAFGIASSQNQTERQHEGQTFQMIPRGVWG